MGLLLSCLSAVSRLEHMARAATWPTSISTFLVSVSDSFREFALEQLGRVTPVTARRMFGGVGIYAGGLFFALMDNNRLYFKVDDSNRPDFEAAGMGPFRPFGQDGAAMQYYEAPPDLLEDADALGRWVTKAIAVARRKRARQKK